MDHAFLTPSDHYRTLVMPIFINIISKNDKNAALGIFLISKYYYFILPRKLNLKLSHLNLF